MAEPKFLKVENDGQVVRIVLDRPKHNVLDIPMMDELNAELEKNFKRDYLLPSICNRSTYLQEQDGVHAS